MSPSTEKRLDRALWYTLSACLAVLILASLIHLGSLDAFVELKTSSLRLEFENEGKEAKMVDFGYGTTVVEDLREDRNLVGSFLNEIWVRSERAELRLEAGSGGRNGAQACLLPGRYLLNTRKSGKWQLEPIAVSPDTELCFGVAIREPFLAYARRIIVEPKADSRGVETYPDTTGKLRIQNTDKELAIVTGMTLQLLFEAKKPATLIALADGRFGMQEWKQVRVSWSDRGKLASYTYTPLDLLRKFAGDNGLWYSISLIVGVGFGVRKVLGLR
jgi:hypothetical protein